MRKQKLPRREHTNRRPAQLDIPTPTTPMETASRNQTAVQELSTGPCLPASWPKATSPAQLKSENVFFDGERVARKDFPGNSVFDYFSDHTEDMSQRPSEVCFR